MTEWMRLISYLLYGLFSTININTGSNWVCNQLKPIINWSVDNVEKHVTSMSCTLKHAIQSCDTGQQIPFFDSCQLTIAWMSTIKLNTDYLYALNTKLRSQSERAYYCSNIMMFEEFYKCIINKKFSAVYRTPEKNLFDDKAPSAWLSRFVRSSMCPLSFFPRPMDSTRCENSTGCIGKKYIVILLN